MTAHATTAEGAVKLHLVDRLMGGLRPVLLLLMLAATFAAAGSVAWRPGWIFVGALVGLVAVNATVLAAKNREIVRERLRTRTDTEPFDRTFGALYCVGMIVLMLVAGLDAGRFGWAPLPAWASWLGAALLALGDVPCVWALRTNRHVETTVRIQTDRGHQVVTTGPYRWVRHPMYAGFIPMTLGMALLLRSAWALLPWVFLSGLIVWRLLREEKVLAQRLEGYSQYMERTRWRLVPGVW